MGTTRRKYAARLPPSERRDQLLDGALGLIADGFGSVTMEAVARSAGVTKPVLYEQFANRGEVIAALLAREASRATEQVLAALPVDFAERGPEEAFAYAVEVFVRAVLEAPNRWRLVLQPPDGTPSEFREQVAAVRGRLLEQVSALAELGLKTRGGPDALDAELLGHAMLALGEMAGRLVLADAERYPPERLAAFVGQIAHLLPK
ncbi:TetR/AcrR family transcriptional regulator [Umezawaea endophytica]|uniref:TetR/AcrR family transcriptional regulator n=1 Tax=Umezawaea endophytica TaxID=1654476 RepID=A0A9X3AJ27_9PSEU|nr:TetR/AcrR family transcriptional regulator [Umezawaea endophytica]MCS7483917.1 TetR/AcrR family transcriptional regulator [Umezawaea endophytica]